MVIDIKTKTLFLSLWDKLVYLNCFSLKFLDLKVYDLNLTIEILHIPNFIKKIIQVIKKIKNSTNKK
jgi:hypothetical protein